MLITKIRDVKLPNRGTPGSAGLDFFIPNDYPEFTLGSGCSVNIPSGIKMVVPHGQAGIFFNKSGVAVKGIFVGACVVDSDYRGEVHLNLHNVSPNPIVFKPGQKVTQMLLIPVSMVNVVEISNDEYKKQEDTQRGSGGFGSTGDK